jgi:proteasome accessory factor A
VTHRVHKVLGTETEFGITIRNQPDFNPVLASSLVINSYAGARARIQWSYDEETPGRDARGFGYEPQPTVDLDTGLVNVVLGNGARLYVDHAHPEYSTPECYDALEGALYDKAGELVMDMAVRAAGETLRPGERLMVHKNNSDGKGNSYGAHENYLLARAVPFGDVVAHMTPFFVSRQIFTGSGKVGSENGRPGVPYQITQRADFFEEEVGLETTLKRPIVNTRDEPHAEPGRYRRLHVIIGDATMSEEQTFLKLGSTALVLAALEAGALPDPIVLDRPVDAVWQVSHDASLRRSIDLADGSTATALELQWRYLEWISAYAETAGLTPVEERVVGLWEETLEVLEREPLDAADRLDWVAKLRLLLGYQERDGLDWTDPKMRLLDLQYHDVDPRRGLYHRLVRAGAMRTLFRDDEVARAAAEPPERTRAYFRGRCIDRYGDAIVAANWDSLVFDVGEEPLKRVPMMEPLRGGKDRVAHLLDDAPTVADLIEALGGEDGRTGAEAAPS